MKITALVTSFNDPIATRRCVNALLKQTCPLTAILVIDNSKNQTIFVTDFCERTAESPELVICHFPENVGVSGAIHEAVKFATIKQCSYLWTFDQDSVPQLDAAEKIIAAMDFQGHNHKGLHASLAYDGGQQRFLFGYRLNRFKFEEILAADTQKPYFCDGTITSGMLIPMIPLINELLPAKALFIDGVDHELCLNFLSNGYRVLMIPESRLVHHMGQPTMGQCLWGVSSRTVHNYSPLRKFYITRNHSYLETRFALREGALFSALLWRMRVSYHMLRESLFERREWLWASIWSIALGTLLGICGKLVPYNKLPAPVRKLF